MHGYYSFRIFCSVWLCVPHRRSLIPRDCLMKRTESEKKYELWIDHRIITVKFFHCGNLHSFVRAQFAVRLNSLSFAQVLRRAHCTTEWRVCVSGYLRSSMKRSVVRATMAFIDADWAATKALAVQRKTLLWFVQSSNSLQQSAEHALSIKKQRVEWFFLFFLIFLILRFKCKNSIVIVVHENK